MTRLPDGGPLIGRFVRLDRATEPDLPALAEILREPEVYASGYTMRHRPDTVAESLAAAREQYLDLLVPDGVGGGRIAYAVRLSGDSTLGSAGTIVGTSSLGEADLFHRRIHLGWTLYHPRVWGTVVNPEAKYLLLRHCFEDLDYGRVKLQTDALNSRSEAAIARLGAQREGLLRHHARREDGSLRDTIVFSVIASDWPRVREGLQDRLAQDPPLSVT